MKKVFMYVVMLCSTLSGFAEKKPIQLEKKPEPHERSEVQLPTASIDGQVLNISFVTNCSFEVSVVDASGVVVYTSAYNALETVIALPQLLSGEQYVLIIEDAHYVYSGEFKFE